MQTQSCNTRAYQIFKEICKIPRGSGNEKELSGHIVAFAKKNKLAVYQDDAYNVIIKKPASAGYENEPPILLQGHLDMVCEKIPESTHDFSKDPISLIEKDGFVTADGTTLGADNGAGIAVILAVLEDPHIAHAALEAVFTVKEEIGMKGMAALDVSSLKANRMLNLDSEADDTLIAGCAGSIRTCISLPLEYTDRSRTAGGSYEISVTGLLGGHSGIDIDKGRANAIILLARTLIYLNNRFEIQVVDFRGGSRENTIPNEAVSRLWISGSAAEICKETEEINTVFTREFGANDPAVTITVRHAATTDSRVLQETSFQTMLDCILLSPCGGIYKTPYMENTIETSCNLAVAAIQGNTLIIRSMIRSSVNSRLDEIAERIKSLANLAHAKIEFVNAYMAWQYNAASKLKKLYEKVYEKRFHKKIRCSTIHGGLECALMAKKRPDMDMISFGANIYDAHTAKERMDIRSFINIWYIVTDMLQERTIS